MSLSKVQAESIDLTATYAFSGTVTDTVTRNLVLLQTLTASSSATLSFTSGIDNTYQSYVFKFINIHRETDSTNFSFQASIDNGSNYNTTVTNTLFRALQNEAGNTTALSYSTGADQAQGTAFIRLDEDDGGNDNDQSLSGTLEIYNPSSTTFVKHFTSQTNGYGATGTYGGFVAGYFNTTSAIDAIQFKMNSGNIDSGTIKMYGVL